MKIRPIFLSPCRKSRHPLDRTLDQQPQKAGRPSWWSFQAARNARTVTTVGMTTSRKFSGPLNRPTNWSSPGAVPFNMVAMPVGPRSGGIPSDFANTDRKSRATVAPGMRIPDTRLPFFDNCLAIGARIEQRQ